HPFPTRRSSDLFATYRIDTRLAAVRPECEGKGIFADVVAKNWRSQIRNDLAVDTHQRSARLPGINDPVPALREQQALVQLVIGVAEIGLAIVEEILRGVRTADPFLPCGPDQVEGIVPLERHHLEIRRSIPSEDRSHGGYDANGCQQADDCTLAHDNSSAFLERVESGNGTRTAQTTTRESGPVPSDAHPESRANL